MVCFDIGYYVFGMNIEFIVMQLLCFGKFGLFDFNLCFYVDDDLIVGVVDLFQFFCILFEVICGGGFNNFDVVFMLDQCYNVEDKILGQICFVLNVQEMIVCVLFVDWDVFIVVQKLGDVFVVNVVFMDVFYMDVCLVLVQWCELCGFVVDLMVVYVVFGYQQWIVEECVGGVQVGWGV